MDSEGLFKKIANNDKEAFTKIEFEEPTENNEEVIQHLQSEIKLKMIPFGTVFIFSKSKESSESGERMIKYKDTNKIVLAAYQFERIENSSCLTIQNDSIGLERYRIDFAAFYLIKDFTKDYASSDYKISSALGASKFTILR